MSLPPDATKAEVLSEEWIRPQLGVVTRMLDARAPISYGSYRDGEWRAILGRGGTNCDGTQLSEGLGGALRDSLTGATDLVAAFWPTGDAGEDVRTEACAWLRGNDTDVAWLPDCPIRRASEAGLLAPFFRALRWRRIVLVGGPHLDRQVARRAIGPHAFVKVSATESWKEAAQAVDHLEWHVRRGADVVLFAAGMGSEVMIHAARPRLPDATLVDIGAVLDPYVGVYSRGYMRDAVWRRDRMPRNLP